MKWPAGELCQYCRTELRKNLPFCLGCKLADPARIIQEVDARNVRRSLRMKHQERAFLDEFDQRAFALTMQTLKQSDKLTVDALIDTLIQERTLLERWAAQLNVALPEDVTDLKFSDWVRKRVIGLGKWWAKNEVAFIGTLTTQGHPYVFYLGKHPDLPFDPTMPSLSKARWSVKKVQRVLHTPKQPDEVEVTPSEWSASPVDSPPTPPAG